MISPEMPPSSKLQEVNTELTDCFQFLEGYAQEYGIGLEHAAFEQFEEGEEMRMEFVRSNFQVLAETRDITKLVFVQGFSESIFQHARRLATEYPDDIGALSQRVQGWLKLLWEFGAENSEISTPSLGLLNKFLNRKIRHWTQNYVPLTYVGIPLWED